jgi:putative DNA methylase
MKTSRDSARGLGTPKTTTALEHGFPFEKVDLVAEVESYRKEVNRPIYHVHKWWANRLGSVFRAILIGAAEKADADIWERFYTDGDYKDFVVLDPFMGSGTTVGEAAKLGMKAVGCDINPVSTFAVRQALQHVDSQSLEHAFSSLESHVATKIRNLYVTKDRETGADIPALYYFWVKVVALPNGERVPLFKDYIFSSNAYPKKKPESRIACPNCGAILTDRFDSTNTTCGECHHRFNPQQGTCDGTTVWDRDGNRHKIKDVVQAQGTPPEHRMFAIMALRKSGEKVYLKPTEDDFARYNQCGEKLRNSRLPIPSMKVRPGHNTNQARGYNYLEWRQFFNDRQLLALSILLDGIMTIKDRVLREQFLCLFSGTLEFNNLFCSFKGEGTGAVRHMFAHHILKPERTPLENSVWGTAQSSGTFSTLFRSRLMRAREYLRRPFEIKALNEGGKLRSEKVYSAREMKPAAVGNFAALSKNRGAAALLLNGDSSSLPIPAASVDAVVTDPPYFDFVHYSELSDFFFAWLAPVLRKDSPCFDRPDSSHEGEVQDRDPEIFSAKIGRVFAECHRVLKTEGILAFTFHHSTTDGWLAIYRALRSAGFVVASAHPIKAEMSVGNPKAATKEPINLDAILVCRKRGGPVLACRDVGQAARDDSARLRIRFAKLGRRLSCGDRFVIEASQVLRHGSLAGLDVIDVRPLLAMAHTRSHESVLTEVAEAAQGRAEPKGRTAKREGQLSPKKPNEQMDLFGRPTVTEAP